MNLDEILKSVNKTVDDIDDIYHGKDNWCRCGCGGRYFRHGERGFTMAINRLKKGDFTPERYMESCGSKWINIPDDTKDNIAYTIYFK